MAQDPGEWYDEQRERAERLAAEVNGARKVFAAMQFADARRWSVMDAARNVVRQLERALELARHVGD